MTVTEQLYCRNCGRTMWEQLDFYGAPSGIFIHHHNGDRQCFPNLVAEVDVAQKGSLITFGLSGVR